jgi:hypothetical protein
MQQWREVGFVIELAAHRQQIAESAATNQLVAVVTEPLQQRRIDLGDGAVQTRRQVPARRVLVQVVGAIFQHGREPRII